MIVIFYDVFDMNTMLMAFSMNGGYSLKRFGLMIVQVQAVFSPYPKSILAVFKKCGDVITTERGAVISIEFELIKLPEVNHLIEALLSSNPNKTLMVLNHTGGFVTGKAVISKYLIKERLLLLGKGGTTEEAKVEE